MERAGREDAERVQARDSGTRAGVEVGPGVKGSREVTEGTVRGKRRDQRVKRQKAGVRRGSP